MIAIMFATLAVSCGSEETNESPETLDDILTEYENTIDEIEDEINGLEDDMGGDIEVESEVDEMDEGGSDAEWDEILDDYEDYVDSYIAILKKQADDPSDMSIMTESMELMEQGTEWTTKMAESSSEFGTEQLTRMTEIQTKLANSVSGL
ncbi:MAG: hypothetical protein P8I55_03055 [Crocinitomix sp.]|nr:hypothetical protein [Crocinitomix sp.]